jgi:hypothetical protein
MRESFTDPSPGLDLSRRSGEGQPRHWAQLEPDTPNNSETLRQITIKATGKRRKELSSL